MQVTLDFLRSHPDHIFVFGDNLKRHGCKGAALFRHEPNAYGFITKKYPGYGDDCYYRPGEYLNVFYAEFHKLEKKIVEHPEISFLITPLGSGLANKHHIWERVVLPGLLPLKKYKNVIFTWED